MGMESRWEKQSRKKQSNITYPQMMAINRHRDTVVETHTHTHSPYQIPNVMKTTENLHVSRASLNVCLYVSRGWWILSTSLCVTSPSHRLPELPHTSTHSHLLPFRSVKTFVTASAAPPLSAEGHLSMEACTCVCTYGSVWETPLGKWCVKK